MPEPENKSAADVAVELNVSPQTLKDWNKAFAAFLSDSAPSTDGDRRYTGDDVVILEQIRDHLSAGSTLEEAAQELRDRGFGEVQPPAVDPPPTALTATFPQQGFGILTDTLRAMIENQQTIQNSLQVNRNLLGVIIQDNFNLKEENSKLRERMLKMEQELGDQKRRDADYRLYLEQRINRMDQALRAETGKSLWQRLFGS